ncbi:MAG: tRNA (adenosine(37)-N6)-dimethylallyltransferase MiaA [Chloroflexi bacterium]|nr:MAG: tRNA (adenosine(37)-N6)-dimethylallyltransferase MiaA [Chloroflexota bacterium]
MSDMARLDLLAVVGPTASGKTDLAIELVEQLDGELISADSRQVYRECDIGTNKPDLEALHGIPCHVIDVVDPGEAFTVADYQRLALAAITQVRGRAKLPILQGGTGLYVRALLDGWNLGDAPPDPGLRATLETRLESEGMEALETELRRVDPTAADQAQRNPRRLIRALEIYAATGRPPSQARRAAPPPWTSLVMGLDVPLAELDRRIEARVDRMLASGLIEEVQRVRARFPRADLRRLGHGYPEIAAYLEGTSCLPDVRQDIIKQVRQYARRQYTWFRADARVQWIDPTGGSDAVLRRLG